MTYKALTAKQKTLLQAVRKGAGLGGVYGLAQALGRNPRRVFDNVALLASRGYLKVSDETRNGRSIKSITSAVTGSVMTVVNVSLANDVTAGELVTALESKARLTPKETAAVVTFFAEVPTTLVARFLREQGIPIAVAASAYKRHVVPIQKLPDTEAWLNDDIAGLETPAA